MHHYQVWGRTGYVLSGVTSHRPLLTTYVVYVMTTIVVTKGNDVKLLYTLSVAALLTACAVTAKPAAESPVTAANCGALNPCLSKGQIAVLADNAVAGPILDTAKDGAASFMRYFGSEIPPIAIVPGGEITPDMQEDLKAAGYGLSLPWMSSADKLSLSQSNVRRQVLEQTKGMSPEQQEAVIKTALANLGRQPSEGGDMSATEQGALTHELGHLWFMSAFKPLGEDDGGGHGYGSWAPDWLDEASAVLLENDALTTSRREAFKTMPDEDFYPLGTFLTMEHPALKAAQNLAEKFKGKDDSGGSRAIFLTGEDADAFLKAAGQSNPANFYIQVRGFADYVIEATGDEQIFAALARHLSQGKSFESWLAKTDGLPSDMKALNKSWAEHLANR